MSVTASEARVSQVSQLNFQRVTMYCSQSDEGYQVTAVRRDDGWTFIASTPEEKVVRIDGVMVFDGMQYKARHELGDDVPPAYDYKTNMVRRSLGHFIDREHGGVDAAREAAMHACFKDSQL